MRGVRWWGAGYVHAVCEWAASARGWCERPEEGGGDIPGALPERCPGLGFLVHRWCGKRGEMAGAVGESEYGVGRESLPVACASGLVSGRAPTAPGTAEAARLGGGKRWGRQGDRRPREARTALRASRAGSTLDL